MPTFKRSVLCHNIIKTLILFAFTSGSSVLVSLMGVGKESVIMVFLLGVLFTTVITSSYQFGIITSFASLMTFNFLFTEPRFTFVIYHRNDIVLLLFFLVTAMVSGVVTSRLQQQKELAAKNERTARILYNIVSGFLSVTGKRNIIRRGISYLSEYTGCDAVIQLEGDEETYYDEQIEEKRLHHVYSLNSSTGILGHLSIYNDKGPVDEQTELIIQAVATQLGIALDKELLYTKQERTRLAMESERLRATLLRTVAHDLRSPLTALLGAGNLLADKYSELSDEERQKLATDISEEIVWLTNLVENILDMTRINESRLVIDKEKEVVDDVVSEAITHLERLLKKRDFSVHLPEKVIMVPMDGRLIVRVLINLLENAVLHTHNDASLDLTVFQEESKVVFRISDTGEGMDEACYHNLFTKFTPVDKKIIDGKRGLGLGLSNCKVLVEAHGGSIWAEPNHPNGSVFIFTLPLDISNEDDSIG